jgi:hypothetical protein
VPEHLGDVVSGELGRVCGGLRAATITSDTVPVDASPGGDCQCSAEIAARD